MNWLISCLSSSRLSKSGRLEEIGLNLGRWLLQVGMKTHPRGAMCLDPLV